MIIGARQATGFVLLALLACCCAADTPTSLYTQIVITDTPFLINTTRIISGPGSALLKVTLDASSTYTGPLIVVTACNATLQNALVTGNILVNYTGVPNCNFALSNVHIEPTVFDQISLLGQVTSISGSSFRSGSWANISAPGTIVVRDTSLHAGIDISGASYVTLSNVAIGSKRDMTVVASQNITMERSRVVNSITVNLSAMNVNITASQLVKGASLNLSFKNGTFNTLTTTAASTIACTTLAGQSSSYLAVSGSTFADTARITTDDGMTVAAVGNAFGSYATLVVPTLPSQCCVDGIWSGNTLSGTDTILRPCCPSHRAWSPTDGTGCLAGEFNENPASDCMGYVTCSDPTLVAFLGHCYMPSDLSELADTISASTVRAAPSGSGDSSSTAAPDYTTMMLIAGAIVVGGTIFNIVGVLAAIKCTQRQKRAREKHV